MPAQRANLPYVSYHVSGDDALTFLQGQLTQDIYLITPETCHYAAYCNPKGRMFASIVLRQTTTGYLFRIHPSVAESVITRLNMFTLRANVDIVTSTQRLIGLNREAALLLCETHNLSLPTSFHCVIDNCFTLYALPNDYFELSVDTADSLPALTKIEENLDAIYQLRLRGGHYDIYPQTSEKLLPQQTPLEAWGGINYKKGCYVGQEIIARNKYLGKVKKGVGYALVDSHNDFPLLSPVLLDEASVGQVIDCHRMGNQVACLALLSLDILGQSVSVGDAPTIFSAVT